MISIIVIIAVLASSCSITSVNIGAPAGDCDWTVLSCDKTEIEGVKGI